MNDSTKREFRIRVSLSPQKHGVKNPMSKDLYRDLNQDVKLASSAIPPELQAKVQEETATISEAKTGGGIEAILLTLMIGTYAIQPILNFIVNLYREKKRRLRITQRWQNAEGETQENEIEYEGVASQKELRSLVEDAVTWSRGSTPQSKSSGNRLLPPNLDIKVFPPSDEEKKQ